MLAVYSVLEASCPAVQLASNTSYTTNTCQTRLQLIVLYERIFSGKGVSAVVSTDIRCLGAFQISRNKYPMTSVKLGYVMVFLLCLLSAVLWRGRLSLSSSSEFANAPLEGRGGDRMSCIGANPGQAEDIFCIEKPKYLSNYKNPCWYVSDTGNRSDGSLQCLPYFHILGVTKAGTDDLFNRLLLHPDIHQHALRKESNFWDRRRYGLKEKGNVFRDFAWYTNVFSGAAREIESHVTNDNFHPMITGDASVPDFSFFTKWSLIPQNAELDDPVILTPDMMNHLYRDPKFIVIFRNPADRLYSCFFYCHLGTTPEDFHRSVVANLHQHEMCLQKYTERQCVFNSGLQITLYTGCYSLHLREWLRVFPREKFLFLKTEDYHTDIKGTLIKVLDFLNLDYDDALITRMTSLPTSHVTHSKHLAGPMLNTTRLILDNFYRKFTRDLSEILQDKRFLWQQ